MFSFHSFPCGCPVFPAPLIEQAVFSPLFLLASFVIDELDIGAWVQFWAFYPVPQIYISVSVTVPYSFDNRSFVVLSVSRKHDSPVVFFFFFSLFAFSRAASRSIWRFPG